MYCVHIIYVPLPQNYNKASHDSGSKIKFDKSNIFSVRSIELIFYFPIS